MCSYTTSLAQGLSHGPGVEEGFAGTLCRQFQGIYGMQKRIFRHAKTDERKRTIVDR